MAVSGVGWMCTFLSWCVHEAALLLSFCCTQAHSTAVERPRTRKHVFIVTANCKADRRSRKSKLNNGMQLKSSARELSHIKYIDFKRYHLAALMFWDVSTFIAMQTSLRLDLFKLKIRSRALSKTLFFLPIEWNSINRTNEPYLNVSMISLHCVALYLCVIIKKLKTIL